ncbi:MAG: ribonuclease P protein component [Deltaproteobacteria bacterium]|nr:ribonuclease P protein component [Deltaproteobacteria bacterium]
MNRRDFVNLNRSGERYRTRHFTIIVKQNGLEITRLGITVIKKTGNAVRRNKVKRLVREYFRLHQNQFPSGYDMVFIAKTGAADLKYENLEEELGEIIVDKKFR